MGTMVTVGSPVEATSIRSGTQIPALTHFESLRLSTEEFRRFLALIETLSGEEWSQPTACSLWTVKDIVAHQAAHVSSFRSIRSFAAQLNPALLKPYRKAGMNMLDAWNQSQVDLRRESSSAELVAEIRAGGDSFLKGRDRVPAWVRGPNLPLPGTDQRRSLGYLFDLIYTRDMWMHRHDICDATGRAMVADATHDGRIVALVARDLAEKARVGLGKRAAILHLTGPAGATYRIGSDSSPEAKIELDAMLFCVLTSGRMKASDVLKNRRVNLDGDQEFGGELVTYFENRVLY
ncbi:MAG: maleylpyruvate isomerase family mycothiol-dependent enzyme [Anaerolineae bacterium]